MRSKIKKKQENELLSIWFKGTSVFCGIIAAVAGIGLISNVYTLLVTVYTVTDADPVTLLIPSIVTLGLTLLAWRGYNKYKDIKKIEKKDYVISILVFIITIYIMIAFTMGVMQGIQEGGNEPVVEEEPEFKLNIPKQYPPIPSYDTYVEEEPEEDYSDILENLDQKEVGRADDKCNVVCTKISGAAYYITGYDIEKEEFQCQCTDEDNNTLLEQYI